MKKAIQLVLPVAVAAVGILMTPPTSYAKKEYTAKEKKPCAYCHVTATSKELNEAGKYYKEHKSLEGYQKK